MRTLLSALICAFAVQQAIAGAGAEVVRTTNAISELLLPKVKVAREAIQKHNKDIDEKTDTFVEAFIYFNFVKGKYVDESPYLELQLDLERSGRHSALVEVLAQLRSRAEENGKIKASMDLLKKERDYLRNLRGDIEEILADASKIELKVDRTALAQLGDDFRSAAAAYAIEIGMDEKDGEPGATDNPDDAQRLREDH